MKNNSRARRQQRRDRARVSLIRQREIHKDTFMDERTTEKTKDSAAKQIIRIDRELQALGEKEKKGASEFKYFLDEVGVS